MNFDHIISDNIGLLHLIVSFIAIITGSLVLALKKGTKTHKKVGYIYSAAMLIVLITSFMMYNLFGKWGIFHWLALVSGVTLISGMIPVLTKWPKENYISLHFSFMYWSVLGLYGAFVAEVLVRLPKIVIESGIPNSTFYNMTGVAVAITMGLGGYFFRKNKGKWTLVKQS